MKMKNLCNNALLSSKSLSPYKNPLLGELYDQMVTATPWERIVLGIWGDGPMHKALADK